MPPGESDRLWPAVVFPREATEVLGPGAGVASWLHREIGSALLVVEAKDDETPRFYQHFEFRSFPDNDHQLFMTMVEAGKV